MVADVEIGAAFHIGKPRELFAGNFVPAGRQPNYAVTPDGKRFVMIRTRNDNAKRSEIQIVLNWLEELKARVPTKIGIAADRRLALAELARLANNVRGMA